MYSQFFLLFALIAVGFICRKTNFITDEMNKSVNKLIIYIAFPAEILRQVSSLDFSGDRLRAFATAFGVGIVFTLANIGIAKLYCRLRKLPASDAPVCELSMFFLNNGFMGFPISTIFLGPEGLLFMSAHNAVGNFFAYSHGVMILSKEDGGGHGQGGKSGRSAVLRSTVKALLNPNLTCVLAGFLLAGFKIQLPEIFMTFLKTLGSITTPMAMIFIGSVLASTFGTGKPGEGRTIAETAFLRLLVSPALVTLLVKALGLTGALAGSCILSSCLSPANVCTMLSQQYGKNARLSGRLLFFCVIGNMVTVPLWMKVWQLWF